MSDCEQTSTGGIQVAADEVLRLKAVIRDLGACLSLPALWASSGPESVAQALLDVLLGMLRADIAYIRLNDPDGGEPFEAVRPETGVSPREVGKLLYAWVSPPVPAASPICVPNFLGSGTLKIARYQLGLDDEGVVAVGAVRADFPTDIDSFLLGAIVTQAILSLRAARNVAQLASAASENARLYQQSVESQRALQDSEERYRRLLGLLPVAVYTCEAPSGIITYYNEHAVRLWGRAPKLGDTDERFCGSFKLRWPDGKPLPHDETPMAVAIREAREFRNQQVVIERPDGTRLAILVNIDPIRNDQGQVTGAINVFHDMTALKEAEEALRQADKRKDEFLAMLGHELRNPLGVISTVVQLMRIDGPLAPKLEEYRDTIELEVKQMARLLNDLLDISRIGRGLIRLKKEPCELGAIIRQVAETHRPMLHDGGLELALQGPEEPLWVMGDRTRLAQIVGNLLHNADKFTDRGGRVDIELRGTTTEKAVLLSVRDGGIGMEPELLARLFEPFVQAEKSLERSRGGLGLGLALVKRLVELHGGTVRASSGGLGKGSEFTVSLPLIEAPALPINSNEAPVQVIRSRRVLIIEDNLSAAQTLKVFLSKGGHIVEVALSGAEGIEVARRFQPKVVLCDIGLPEIDGYAVAQALRQELQLQDAYLIAVSGYGQDADHRRALEAGFDSYFTKPVDLQALEQLLGNSIADEQAAGK